MLNLGRLALLVEYQRRGTITGVGDALSYSPSTVSQQLKVLEREAGASLFELVGRSLRLTRQGELLAQHGADLLARAEAAQADIAAVRSRAIGTLHMAAFQTAALVLLPRMIDVLAETEPELRLTVSHIDPAQSLDALASREHDLVLGEEYPGRPVSRRDGLVLHTLMEDPMLVVAPLHADVEPVETLIAERDWVMEPEPNDARQWAVAACRAAGVEPRVQYESPDLLVQMRLAETGHAIAVLPQLLLDSERPQVRTTELPGSPARRVFAAVRAGTGHSPAIAATLRALQQSVAMR